MAEPLKKAHTLADHLMGADGLHVHDDESDHDHDHDDFGDFDPDTDALWLQDHLTLVSVGIDIGSSGTQVIFSRVHMRRLAEELTSRYFVVNRETLYQSPVTLTPYQSEERIDERAVGQIIDDAYTAANIHPDQIDTGAVILTGEALRRENAKAIADVLAEMGGEFVCATAGHHMESLLAAYGSGAAKASHDVGQPVLNVDIGGGTTKLALVEGGRVVHTAAIHVGGRLAVVDESLRLTRLDPAGKQLAKNAGLDWKVGGGVTEAELGRITEWMADALVAALTQSPTPAPVDALWLTEPLEPVEGIAGVMFSGGVGEYVYGREERDFGDLGRRFGRALRKRLDAGALPWKLLPAGECIRATAIGASEYSVQLSGNTVYISNPAQLLPRKNLQVLQPDISLAGDIDAARVTQAIRRHFESFDLREGEAEVALALRWLGPPSYARLAALARGIVEALPMTLLEARPLFLVLDGDIGHSLGALLKEEWSVTSEVLVIDGVSLWDFDYIDLGRVRMPSFTVPVTIKSLVFSEDPRGPRARSRPHHHDTITSTTTTTSTATATIITMDTASTTHELKRQLADALRMMERAEVIDFNGHMSCRLPGSDHLLINSGKSVRSALGAADIIAIDMDGKPVGGDVIPPMEFHLHTEIYRRRRDVNAVAHTHPLWSTLFSMVGERVEPVTMQAAVMGPVQFFAKTASINEKSLGEELAAALGNHRVAMLKSHGAVVVGADIVETFVLAIYLEETARRQYLARAIGTPQVLTAAEVEKIGGNLRKPHLLKKVWDYHHAKLTRNL